MRRLEASALVDGDVDQHRARASSSPASRDSRDAAPWRRGSAPRRSPGRPRAARPRCHGGWTSAAAPCDQGSRRAHACDRPSARTRSRLPASPGRSAPRYSRRCPPPSTSTLAGQHAGHAAHQPTPCRRTASSGSTRPPVPTADPPPRSSAQAAAVAGRASPPSHRRCRSRPFAPGLWSVSEPRPDAGR